jgi:hypothetical protein
MMNRLPRWCVCVALLGALLPCPTATAADGANLLDDPSFEEPKARDQFGGVFAKWGGWKYEGECEFRVGQVARTGKTSCLLFGGAEPKIRVTQKHTLEPGRYKITAYLRGLDLGEGKWRQTTEFAFDDKYFPLQKNGTFGWTPLSYVVDVPAAKEINGPSFGLMAPGYFWIDDVAMIRVGNDVPLTPTPVLGKEEKPLEPPAELTASAIRCAECGYRNRPESRACYACGTALESGRANTGPAVKLLTSFEEKSPFGEGQIVSEHATDGQKAMRIDRSYASWQGKQDWSGYDYLVADVFTPAPEPLKLYVEIRDAPTTGYWTRVNYHTLVPPGRSKLVLPLDQLYVGEKSRPGRNLLLGDITQFVLSVGDDPAGPLLVDNIRLERDTKTAGMLFEGLHAFDLGTAQSPLMPGFRRIDPGTLYSKGRGYGLMAAQVWRALDALQPEPLYQDFICIERGGLAVDVPNGRYAVMVNLDSPSGFWGEYQVYPSRTVRCEGSVVARDTMDVDALRAKYFRYWDVEDSADQDTFDKYQRGYFAEKRFEVDVTDGQLNLEFEGQNWACSVSAVVIYPVSKAAAGEAFLDYVVQRRRFFFDNYFRRIVHQPTGDALAPSAEQQRRGYVVFTRDAMEDVFDNDTPRKDEIGEIVKGFGFAGEHEPLTIAIHPLRDLEQVTISISDLTGPATIPADRISLGHVSNRLTRVAMDGSVYTIAPRLIIPRNTAAASKGVSRRFWLNVCPPADAPAGVYRGQITLTPKAGEATSVAVEYRVFGGTLDEVDIPVGPWGYQIRMPGEGLDPAVKQWNETMGRRSLEKLRECGFTSFSGMPTPVYRGFRDGKPQFDFTAADRQMALARQCGFTMPLVNYAHFDGLNLYYKDDAAMRAAGFTDYGEFIRAVFGAIQEHAEKQNWLPVYWNLGDEPIGDDLRRAAENAEAYRAAFPKGPPLFTAATSLSANMPEDDGHFRFARALQVANINLHDEPSLERLHKAGGQWAFYNGGNRWTFGTYLYKCAKQFDMKFRLSWHWNVTAGDPYYALDCREDDYAWCNSSPQGELIGTLHFEREIRQGLDDYRYLLTLARLAEARGDAAAKALIAERMAAFRLGQRDHDKLFPIADWREFRLKVAEAIERLR